MSGWRRWCLPLMVMTVALVTGLYRPHGDWYWQDLFLSRDQQGYWLFQRGDYRRAALRFQRPDWQAIAYYAAQDFDAAATIWAQLPGARYHFNRANALAHQENYSAAADGYRLSLRLQKDWPAAQENLALVQALDTGAEPFDGDRATQGSEVGADEIVFDADKKNLEKSEQETSVAESQGLTSAQINALWMRRLQSTPADFLRLKFAYQSADAKRSASRPIETSAEPNKTPPTQSGEPQP